MEELKILQKTYDMLQYLYQAMQQYPKAEKYALADNTKLPMTLADLAGFPAAEMARSQQLHNLAGEIKARIVAAETVAAIDAILAEPNLWEGE